MMANEPHSSRRMLVLVFFPPLIVRYVLTHDWAGDCTQVQEAPLPCEEVRTKAALSAGSEGVYQPVPSVCARCSLNQ